MTKEEAQQRLNEITLEFERGFGSVVEFNRSQPHPHLAPTGEPYIAYIQGRPSKEGEISWRPPFDTVEEGLSFIKEELLLLQNPEASLYWRIKPELDFISPRDKTIYWDASPGGWIFYARFLISNKSVITING